MSSSKKVFIFGYGYSAAFLAKKLLSEGWEIAATTRNPLKQQELIRLGITVYDFHDAEIARAMQDYPYILISTPPTKDGDAVLKSYGDAFQNYTGKWVGFLSTTGIYGDHNGAWVTEETPPAGQLSARRLIRLNAEKAWLRLHQQINLPVHIFRLAGIYGIGRGIGNPSELKQAIVKEGHYFSRIHGADIAGAIYASMHKPNAGRIYNLADNEPAPKIEVIKYAAKLLNLPAPLEVPYSEVKLEGMVADFWKNNKRISNQRLKDELAYSLQYPTYREGLQAIYGVCDGEKSTYKTS